MTRIQRTDKQTDPQIAVIRNVAKSVVDNAIAVLMTRPTTRENV